MIALITKSTSGHVITIFQRPGIIVEIYDGDTIEFTSEAVVPNMVYDDDSDSEVADTVLTARQQYYMLMPITVKI